MRNLVANIWQNGHLVEAEISFKQKISQIKILGQAKEKNLTLYSGFIDLHIHGGGGHDFMEADQGIKKILETHARFGTTSMLATTMTAPFEELLSAFKVLKDLYPNRPKKGSRLLGVHLEGPFISPNKLGAQPDFTREASLKEIKELHSIVPIKVITLAPEVFNHLQLIGELKKMGIVVQIGHTNGSYEEGVSALNQGAKSFTHLFNAMSSFHHRAPGMTGAALAHAEFAELIPDLEHVHPGAIKAALRSIPQLYFVTDATSATGMPDGDYKLGSHTVHKCLGGVRLKDGTLAGSALTMDQAFRNLLTLDISAEETSRRLSTIPAQLINENSVGKIEANYFADFVLLNSKNEIAEVIIDGETL